MRPTLPLPIITNITQHCIPSLEECDDCEAEGVSPFVTLARLALVAHVFLDVARPALYRRITLWHGPSATYSIAQLASWDQRFRGGPTYENHHALVDDLKLDEPFTFILHRRATSQLLRSLRLNRHLADLVRVVSFGRPEDDDASERCEVEALSTVLCLCRNLTMVNTVYGGEGDRPWSARHLHSLLGGARLPVLGLNLVVDSLEDIQLFQTLPHLIHLGIGYSEDLDSNSFFNSINSATPLAPFELSSLRLSCPANNIASTVTFLTAKSTDSLTSLQLECVGSIFPSTFAFSAFPNLLHVQLDHSTWDRPLDEIIPSLIDLVSPLANLLTFVCDAPDNHNPASASLATEHLRRLPSSLESLGISFTAISLPTLIGLLQDRTFLPRLQVLARQGYDWRWNMGGAVDQEEMRKLEKVCEERQIGLTETPWELDLL